MRVTTAGRYALRAMLDLALNGQGGPVLRQEITARQEISSEYIAQIFRPLLKAGLARSVMGPGGGYQLALPPAAITVGDILRAVEGPFAAVACLLPAAADARPCPRSEACAARILWQRLTAVIETYLDSVTLLDVCRLSEQLQECQTAAPNQVEELLNPFPNLPECPAEFSI